jgi:YVTN family beta-propeller protein
MPTQLLGSFVLALAAAASADGAAPAEWKEISRHALGGAGGWDLLTIDAPTRRVFITRGDHLMVADVDTGKVLGDIPGLHRAHGVVLVSSLQRGYVSSGGDDRVMAFDLRSLKPLAGIPTGKNPDAMAFDRASGHVFVFNGNGNDATVIDTTSNRVVATVPLPGKPELAVSDGKGKLFVNLEDKNQISAIDAKSTTVVSTWDLGTCEEPTGIALDIAHARLFTVCANKQMAVLDANSGRIVASLPIGDGPDGATFDAASSNAFSSNSDGTLTIVHEDDPNHFRVLATVPTPARSRTITLDEKTHRVVLPMASFDPAHAATSDEPHPRPLMKAGTFGFIVIGQH